jgi:excisionase family DNA binding protein
VTTPVAELPALLADLEAAKALAWLRLQRPETEQREPAKLLDAKEMAARLSLKPSWLLELARQGRVPHRRLGRYVRFDPAAVQEWLGARADAADGGRSAK